MPPLADEWKTRGEAGAQVRQRALLGGGRRAARQNGTNLHSVTRLLRETRRRHERMVKRKIKEETKNKFDRGEATESKAYGSGSNSRTAPQKQSDSVYSHPKVAVLFLSLRVRQHRQWVFDQVGAVASADKSTQRGEHTWRHLHMAPETQGGYLCGKELISQAYLGPEALHAQARIHHRTKAVART